MGLLEGHTRLSLLVNSSLVCDYNLKMVLCLVVMILCFLFKLIATLQIGVFFSRPLLSISTEDGVLIAMVFLSK